MDIGARARRGFEGLFGVGQDPRIIEEHQFAAIAHPVLAPRRHYLPALVAGLQCVAVDLLAIEHKGHAPVREVDARRHLGAPLVRSIADAQPATNALFRIPEVDVAALVESQSLLLNDWYH